MLVSAKTFARRATMATLLSAVLASCAVVVDEGPGPGPRPPRPGPQMCTREYDPVCAQRGRDSQTFGNACMAEAAGYRITRRGECRGSNNGGWNGGGGNNGGWNGGGNNGGWNGGGGNNGGWNGGGNNGGWNGGGSPRACTREYRPVCGQRGGTLRTFPNGCEADSAGFRVVDQGPC